MRLLPLMHLLQLLQLLQLVFFFTIIHSSPPNPKQVLHWGDEGYTPLTRDEVTKFRSQVKMDSSDPEQVHIVFGGTPDSYVVQFVTFANTSDGVKSIVEYGTDPIFLSNKEIGQPFVFTDSCNISRLIHNVELKGLLQGVRYYYRVNAGGNWSKQFTFLTINQSKTTLTVACFGDMGSHSAINVIAELVKHRDEFDEVVHFGDIAYNLVDNCSTVGDKFMRDVESVAAFVPYVFGIGNHESEPFFTYTNYLMRYSGEKAMALASGSDNVRWFSWETGRVHFAMFDTDAWIYPPVFNLAKPQFEFLKKDLASVNRTKTPWVVVFGHRSMYCTKSTDPECNGEATSIRNGILGQFGIEQLLLEYGVDMYFGGHTHHYMRTWPVKKGKLQQMSYVDPRAPVHVQSGIGGVDGQDEFTVEPRPYDAFRDEQYYRSYTLLRFFNDTHLQVQQLNAADGEVFDEFTLIQHQHGPFV